MMSSLGRDVLIFRHLRRITASAFVRLKGRHFNVVYQNAPFNLMAWCLFMANQKNSREYLSKHFLIRLNRDLAVDASRNIRIIIGPGLRRFQRLKLGNHR